MLVKFYSLGTALKIPGFASLQASQHLIDDLSVSAITKPQSPITVVSFSKSH